MARGVFSGVIWGTVVAGLGAGGLSLAYPDFKPDGTDAMAKDVAMAEPVVEEAVEPEADVVKEPEVEVAESEPEAEVVEAEVTEPEAEVYVPEAEEAEQQVSEDAEPESEAPEANVAEEPETEMAESDATVAEPAAMEAEEVVEEVAADADVVEPEAPIEEVEEPVAEDVAESITDEIIAALPKTEGTVGDLAPDVKTNRLPSLSDEEEPASAEASAIAPPPFERFQSDFEPDSDKPRMSIVLIDNGEGALGVEALEDFPYPLTFAVDAASPNAGERMQVYRDKGFEVLALVDLPRGATPSDVEVAMSAHLAAVPEAVGILEGVKTGVQSSREMADQLTQIILDSGHGMLLQSSGLNTARKLAEREGIPAGTVFRDFDGNAQSASVMRRFLDQAAFRAGQEGGVVMMGRLQAETISALLIWGLADRASRVALVPVSDVLKQGE